jgi:hypothetical protein
MSFQDKLPSLCIPRVDAAISVNHLWGVFVGLCLGEIDQILLVPKGRFNFVIIHFKFWYRNRYADSARREILNGVVRKVFYGENLLWNVRQYIPRVNIAPGLSVSHEQQRIHRQRREEQYHRQRREEEEQRQRREEEHRQRREKEQRQRREEQRQRREKEQRQRREEEQRQRREEEQQRERETLTHEEIHALKVAEFIEQNTQQIAPPPMTKHAKKIRRMNAKV